MQNPNKQSDCMVKVFRISVSGFRLKSVFGYPYPVANWLSCRISNRQTG